MEAIQDATLPQKRFVYPNETSKMKVYFNGKSANLVVRDKLDLIQRHWIQKKFYEADKDGILPYIYQNFKGGTMVDVGAAYGNHTVFFAILAEAKVIAIEPVGSHFSFIKQNISANNLMTVVRPINCAVSNEPGTGSMIHSGIEGRRGGSTMHKLGEGDEVEVRTLDSILKDVEDITLIKIDVEGHELEVLQGAEETLKKHPALFVEITEGLAEITDYLAGFGYRRNLRVFNKTPTYLFEA